MSAARSAPVRSRSETRRRLLGAAASLFDETGTISQRVEEICARAGFTRGAFYSNYTGVDQLYLALHEEQAAAVGVRLQTALDDELADDCPVGSLDDAVARLLAALPAAAEWFSLRAVLLARAAADASFADRMMIDDGVVAEGLGERFAALAARHGRVPLVEASLLAKAVVAAHIGAVGQAAVDSAPDRTQLAVVTGVLRGLTRSATPGQDPA
ncbi:TetR/AcrR family transcriptional regulator [Microbacterium sp. NPDC091313]